MIVDEVIGDMDSLYGETILVGTRMVLMRDIRVLSISKLQESTSERHYISVKERWIGRSIRIGPVMSVVTALSTVRSATSSHVREIVTII